MDIKSYRYQFSNFGTLDILDWTICCGRWSFALPGVYPLDASSSLPPVIIAKNVSKGHLENKISLVENPWYVIPQSKLCCYTENQTQVEAFRKSSLTLILLTRGREWRIPNIPLASFPTFAINYHIYWPFTLNCFFFFFNILID